MGNGRRTLSRLCKFKAGAFVCAAAGCVALAGCRQSRVPSFSWPFAPGLTAEVDQVERKTPVLTPSELAAAHREQGKTFGFSDRARAIEQRLGME